MPGATTVVSIVLRLSRVAREFIALVGTVFEHHRWWYLWTVDTDETRSLIMNSHLPSHLKQDPFFFFIDAFSTSSELWRECWDFDDLCCVGIRRSSVLGVSPRSCNIWPRRFVLFFFFLARRISYRFDGKSRRNVCSARAQHHMINSHTYLRNPTVLYWRQLTVKT